MAQDCDCDCNCNCNCNAASTALHSTEYRMAQAWNDEKIVQCVEAALRLRTNVLNVTDKSTWKLYGTIEATKEDYPPLSVSIMLIEEGTENIRMHDRVSFYAAPTRRERSIDV